MKDLKTGAYIEKCKTGIFYFWIETLTGKDVSVELTALNREMKQLKTGSLSVLSMGIKLVIVRNYVSKSNTMP